MCQCSQRRAAVVSASRAALSGDTSLLVPAAAFVVRTLAQDAGRAAAKARLALGARR